MTAPTSSISSRSFSNRPNEDRARTGIPRGSLDGIGHLKFRGRGKNDIRVQPDDQFLIHAVIRLRDKRKAGFLRKNDFEKMVIMAEEIIEADQALPRSQGDDDPGDLRL